MSVVILLALTTFASIVLDGGLDGGVGGGVALRVADVASRDGEEVVVPGDVDFDGTIGMESICRTASR